MIYKYIYIIYDYIIQIKESATAHRASMQENIDYIMPETQYYPIK
jgi:hypothetical protein